MKAILFCALFSISAPAFAAKHVSVLRNFPLPAVAQNKYELRLHFAEKKPGVISNDPETNGCSFLVRSAGNFLFMARYRVSLEEQTGPQGPDQIWRKQYTTWASGFDMRVTCKSSREITEDYIRRVMAGYVRIEL